MASWFSSFISDSGRRDVALSRLKYSRWKWKGQCELQSCFYFLTAPLSWMVPEPLRSHIPLNSSFSLSFHSSSNSSSSSSIHLSAFLPQPSLFPQTGPRALGASFSPTNRPLSWECGSTRRPSPAPPPAAPFSSRLAGVVGLTGAGSLVSEGH